MITSPQLPEPVRIPVRLAKAEGEALVGKELPALPEKGKLDVTQVRDSEFFFA